MEDSVREDIIRMAREAGYGDALSMLHSNALERFATLVAAAEREACAKVCDDIVAEHGNDVLVDWFAKDIRARGEK